MAHSWHTQSELVTFLAQRLKKHRWDDIEALRKCLFYGLARALDN